MAKKRRPSGSKTPRRKRGELARGITTAVDIAGEAGVFVIMLDDLLRVHPHHFPITAQSSDIDTLRAMSQHDGRFTLVPRGTSSAELLENKDLINAITGQIDEGGIYRITAR
jgi:hypothetical protein